MHRYLLARSINIGSWPGRTRSPSWWARHSGQRRAKRCGCPPMLAAVDSSFRSSLRNVELARQLGDTQPFGLPAEDRNGDPVFVNRPILNCYAAVPPPWAVRRRPSSARAPTRACDSETTPHNKYKSKAGWPQADQVPLQRPGHASSRPSSARAVPFAATEERERMRAEVLRKIRQHPQHPLWKDRIAAAAGNRELNRTITIRPDIKPVPVEQPRPEFSSTTTYRDEFLPKPIPPRARPSGNAQRHVQLVDTRVPFATATEYRETVGRVHVLSPRRTAASGGIVPGKTAFESIFPARYWEGPRSQAYGKFA